MVEDYWIAQRKVASTHLCNWKTLPRYLFYWICSAYYSRNWPGLSWENEWEENIGKSPKNAVRNQNDKELDRILKNNTPISEKDFSDFTRCRKAGRTRVKTCRRRAERLSINKCVQDWQQKRKCIVLMLTAVTVGIGAAAAGIGTIPYLFGAVANILYAKMMLTIMCTERDCCRKKWLNTRASRRNRIFTK